MKGLGIEGLGFRDTETSAFRADGECSHKKTNLGHGPNSQDATFGWLYEVWSKLLVSFLSNL